MNNCCIIILGITGDLGTKKIIPALYGLIRDNKNNFAFVGAGYEAMDAKQVLERARAYIPEFNEQIWTELTKRFVYQQMDVTKEKDFQQLERTVQDVEQKFNLSGNRLIYLAIPAHYFCDVTQSLLDAQIIKRNFGKEPWHRIAYEKPFGQNLLSACDINECIAQSLQESQVYRIDHYLIKELVSNIALVRFTNSIFEPLWNHQYIENVQIYLNESVGIENRGTYYDEYGVVKDVVQNHMLQMLALIAMEAPTSLQGDDIREKKAQVLAATRVVDGFLGQYQGYQQEKAVKQNSKTATFAALQLAIDTPRWKGVPFYLKTGKRLKSKETSVYITFKPANCLLTSHCPPPANQLIIRVFPDEGFVLKVNAKVPGKSNDITQVPLDFCHSCLFGPDTTIGYEQIFKDILAGQLSIGVRFDEIESAWKIVDALEQVSLPLYHYEQNSTGPKELIAFARKHNMEWQT